MSFQSWHYTLLSNDKKTGLFDRYSVSDLFQKVIVCQSTEKGRRFKVFNSYLDLNQVLIGNRNQNLYEVILGEYAQKPHFDIDINDPNVSGENVISELVHCILKVFSERFKIDLSLGDILLYTSKGGTKQSYHLLINKYCQSSNEECKELYNQVIKYINPDFIQYIDSAVYSNRQQFRLLNNSKFGSDRIKVFMPVWTYYDRRIMFNYNTTSNDQEVNNLNDLQRSLISEVSGCTFLPSLITKKKVEFKTEEYDIDFIRNKLNAYDPSFEISKQEKNIIVLKRHQKSFCNMCGRIHDNENPFLSIIDSKIFINCRRSNSREFIGEISKPESIVIDIPNNTVVNGLSTKDILKNMRNLSLYGKKCVI